MPTLYPSGRPRSGWRCTMRSTVCQPWCCAAFRSMDPASWCARPRAGARPSNILGRPRQPATSPTFDAYRLTWATGPRSRSRKGSSSMSPGSNARPKILLKARPTREQLADRLQPPPPEGLELYLDGRDIDTPAARDEVVARLQDYDLPPGFALVVEGPIRGLDGEYFDLADRRAANFELVRVLAELGGRLGAEGLV